MAESSYRTEEADLQSSWRQEHESFAKMLQQLNATEEAFTLAIHLRPTRIRSPQQFAEKINRSTEPNERWSIMTTLDSTTGERQGFALPTKNAKPEQGFLLPLLEIHTLLIAWWLCSAWRAQQLANAAISLADARQTIAAAACVRPLAETAAATWVDGNRLCAAWSALKSAGEPGHQEVTLRQRNELLTAISEATWGSKFDDRAADLKSTWGRVQRSNVLGQVEKLSRLIGSQFQADYQWLCNTVHPSIGNRLAFSAPPMMHETGTHTFSWLSPWPTEITGGPHPAAERTIQFAIARAAASSITSLRTTLDGSLRFIDDLALTSQAPAIAPRPYWRQIVDVSRNVRCPCRSGFKRKHCRHNWGESGPRMIFHQHTDDSADLRKERD